MKTSVEWWGGSAGSDGFGFGDCDGHDGCSDCDRRKTRGILLLLNNCPDAALVCCGSIAVM
ncbi:MAG: hypothetical protein ACK5A3_22745 [Planctomyces sp.]